MFASKIVSDPEVQLFIVKMVVGEDRPFAGVSSAGDLARQPLPVMLVAMKLFGFLTWFPNLSDDFVIDSVLPKVLSFCRLLRATSNLLVSSSFYVVIAKFL